MPAAHQPSWSRAAHDVESRRQARDKYALGRQEPFHPSLHFKELATDLWSARNPPSYRALARRRDELVVWFWIGTHAEYDRLINRP